MSTPHLICPQCGSDQVIPIIYGMPDEELVLKDAAGEAVIGGVAQYDYSPEWHCRDCSHQWRAQAVADNAADGGLNAEEAAALRAQLEGDGE